MFNMGRGTGHFALSSSAPPATSPAFATAAASSSRRRCCINTVRRLRFNASALGHDRDRRMRRTARFDAVLRARVSDRLCTDCCGADDVDVDAGDDSETVESFLT